MAVNDIYRVSVFYNIGSELTENVLHLKEKVASTDDVPAKTIAEIIYNVWNTWYVGTLFSDQSHVTAINVRRIKPTAGVPTTLLIGTATHPTIAGASVSAPVPGQAAALISLYTAVTTKSGRGRVYIPGVAGAMQNDGQLLDAGVTQLQLFADEFGATEVAIGPGTGEWDWVVYSRKLVAGNKITSGEGHSNLATIRGRRNFPGIGI